MYSFFFCFCFYVTVCSGLMLSCLYMIAMSAVEQDFPSCKPLNIPWIMTVC